MAIVIKKKDGQVKELPRASATGPASETAPAPAPVPEKDVSEQYSGSWEKTWDASVELFCNRLEKTSPQDIDGRAEVVVAYWLGMGSFEARHKLDMDLVITAEWPRLLPWFAQPYVGDQLLPPNATWEVHRVEVEGGMGGYATVKIGEHVFQSTARTPWAAFAVCLIKAKHAGLFKTPAA